MSARQSSFAFKKKTLQLITMLMYHKHINRLASLCAAHFIISPLLIRFLGSVRLAQHKQYSFSYLNWSNFSSNCLQPLFICLMLVFWMTRRADISTSHETYYQVFFKFQWNLKFNDFFFICKKIFSALHEEAKCWKVDGFEESENEKKNTIILRYNSLPVWPIPYTFKFIKNAIILIEGAQLAAEVIMNLGERETKNKKKEAFGKNAMLKFDSNSAHRFQRTKVWSY